MNDSVSESTSVPKQSGAELLPFVAPTPAQMMAASAIVDSQAVVGAYAAAEWAELGEDGKVWIAAIVREASAAAGHMGVTGNAIVLLSALTSATTQPDAGLRYDLVEANLTSGTAVLRACVSGNTFRVSVVQLEGVE